MIQLLLAILISANSSHPLKNNLDEKRLPAKFQMIDLNEDQQIQAREVNIAIERFFTGDPRLDSKTIDEVIDYFFEQ